MLVDYLSIPSPTEEFIVLARYWIQELIATFKRTIFSFPIRRRGIWRIRKFGFTIHTADFRPFFPLRAILPNIPSSHAFLRAVLFL